MFRLIVLNHKEILTLEHHNTITRRLHQVTMASQPEKILQALLSSHSAQPQQERVCFKWRLCEVEDNVRERCKRRITVMGLSFMDVIIIALVILCVVIVLMLLNWISKQGDR